jgi:hypothetical protein
VEALACKPRVEALDKNRTDVDESLHHAESQAVRSRRGITAATKAKKELSMFEARAIQDLSARLAPTASRAQERYLALKQRVIDRSDRDEKRKAQTASVEGEPHRSRLRVKVMPSDGHCLYHALENGLRQRSRRQDERHVDYRRLRWRISSYMLDHPDEELGGTSIRQWVKHETRRPIQAYASGMRTTGWGGAIEIEVAARLFVRQIDVYKRVAPGTEQGGEVLKLADGTLIRKFFSANEGPGKERIDIVFEGGNHYNALEAQDEVANSKAAAKAEASWASESHGSWKKTEENGPPSGAVSLVGSSGSSKVGTTRGNPSSALASTHQACSQSSRSNGKRSEGAVEEATRAVVKALPKSLPARAPAERLVTEPRECKRRRIWGKQHCDASAA